VCLENPGRVVEAGSGHSTRFLARAIVNVELSTDLTAIDPALRPSQRSAPATCRSAIPATS
jgi:hypothetical protein